MNSISEKLNAATIVATSKMLRSAKKEIFLLVEGDEDIALLSNVLGIPRSNFISCFGKERLMEVFGLAPIKGIDEGTIFFRDRDFDDVISHKKSGVLILVSDLYDFEISLLKPRVFNRIFSEFLKTRATTDLSNSAFLKLTEASAHIGALRLASKQTNCNIDFNYNKMPFIRVEDLSVNIENMITYFLSRSGISLKFKEEYTRITSKILGDNKDFSEISCGKDFLFLLSIALSHHFRCCRASDCTYETLARMFRISVIQDDMKQLSLYQLLLEQVETSEMSWKGHPL